MNSGLNKRFPVLSLASIILRLIGALMFIGGVLGFIASYAGRQSPNAIDLLISAAVAIVGLILVVMGEMIGVAFAIEANTRQLWPIEKNTRESQAQSTSI